MTSGNVDLGYSTTDSYGNGAGNFYRKTWAGSDWSSYDSGTRPPHGYAAVPFVKAFFPVIKYRDWGGPIQERSSASIGGSPNFPRYISELNNIAINKLYGDIKGSDFNAALFGSQLHQTLKMFGDNASKLGKAWNRAKRGDFIGASLALTGRAKGPRNKVANNWLELQYGWLPLLKDTYDGAKFIESKLQNIEPVSFKVKVSKKGTGEWNAFYKNYVNTSHLSAVQIVAILSEKVSLTAQLGLTDPASIVWELTPYSFVLDWFLPIGPYLEAVSAARTMKGDFWRTNYIKDTANGLISSTPISGFTIFEVLDGSGLSFKYVNIELYRVHLDGLNPSLPSFKPLEKALSLGHALNGLALLSNLKR